jgi:Flp pilus assembly protein TadD
LPDDGHDDGGDDRRDGPREDHDREVTPIEIGRLAHVELLLSVGQVTRARQLALDQIAADPEDSRSYVALARVHLRAGDHDAAIAAAEQAIRLAPEWPAVWRIHAAALFSAGRFAGAEKSLLEAIRLDPDDGSLFEMYARVLSLCGRPKDALVWAERALQLDPDDETAHHLFAALLHQVHPSQWQVSEDLARRAVSLNPQDADSFAVLGAILVTRRRFDEAEEHFRTALSLEPTNRLALQGLAQIVMGKNPIYRPFLSYQLAMMRLGTGAQLLVVASLWALVSTAHALLDDRGLLSTIVTTIYLAFCAYTWFALPVTRAILRRKYPWL